MRSNRSSTAWTMVVTTAAFGGIMILSLGAATAAAGANDGSDRSMNAGTTSDTLTDLYSSNPLSSDANQSLLWGVYRPNLYFGTRPRLPDTVMTGLMWFGLQDYSGADHIRHGCEEGDKMERYGWLKHDGRGFGLQQIKDTKNNLELTTEFIKVPGGSHGGSWGARISGKPLRPEEPMAVSMMYYVGLDGLGEIKPASPHHPNADINGPIRLSGRATNLGEFTIQIEQDAATTFRGFPSAAKFVIAPVPAATTWRAKDYTRNMLINNANAVQQSGRQAMPEAFFSLPNQDFGEGGQRPNMYIYQLNYDEPFQFEVTFNSGSSPNPISSEIMSTKLEAASQAFDERFENTFHLKNLGYTQKMVEFAQAAMSNMVGGIGYFYGSAMVDLSPTLDEGVSSHLEGPVARRPMPNPQLTEPASLFSAVPSRSFFPRGFYWDEGFHQNLIGVWDNDLSLEIIESWYNRQDKDGWIQREQILGDEARSRVPEAFQIQYPEHANPPTLLTSIGAYIDRYEQHAKKAAQGQEGDAQVTFGQGSSDADLINAHLEPTLAREYMKKLYPKLKTNYYWMRRTLQGQIRDWGRQSRSRTEGYRWRGRTRTHTLTSGLDDYPRASEPHVGELHVDLLSWIGYMSHNLERIATILGEDEDQEDFEDHYASIKSNLKDLHWNEDEKMYCDLTVNELGDSEHVCHKGYVSLFPLALGLIDAKSAELGHVLAMAHNPRELWSPFGLRSLSVSDPEFGTGENYWKGPIWININYLVLQSLKKNYLGEGPNQAKAKALYNALRENVINNLYNEYERSGFVWEQYNDKTGYGQRSHPFTGWTSMVVLMMTMGEA